MDTSSILGTPIAVTDYAGAIGQAKSWARAGAGPYLIAAANTHVVTLARHDRHFRESLDRFDLCLPDGMPLLWVLNGRLAEPLRERVYGPTFMLHCLEATQGSEWSHTFIGGSEELLEELRAKLLCRFPKLQIAATYSPPFGAWPADEDVRIVENIRRSGAQFVWFGLGCPKQENWMARNKASLPAGVYSAVGAAFAFHAGRVRQAPPWVQRIGFEWLFRLVSEPRRLWRRYLTYNSLFLFYLVRDFSNQPKHGAI